MPITPGQELLHYRIVAKLGEGGMGAVYRAEDTRLGREVAIKVMPAELAADPQRRQRFEQEARAVAALNHPNIVTVFSVEQADGVSFITMELIEGQPLSALIPDGGFDLARLFEVAIPAAEALSSAHAKGITHRDLKPANMMLDADGRLKVLDFGLAKLMAADLGTETATQVSVPSSPRTEQGTILGTAGYMSPEQAEGKPVDARTDIFSLGVVLFEMATGSRPFQGDTAISMISSILKDTPPRVSDLKPALPRHLGRIIDRCLEKNPAKRFQTARDVATELENLKKEVDSGELASEQTSGVSHVSVPSQPPHTSPGSHAIPEATSRRRPWLAIGVVVLMAIVGGAWWTLRHRDATPAGPTTTAPAAAPARSMIAVLPFENLGPPEDAYFAAGVADEIIGRLSTVSGLGVISRTSVTQYDRAGKSLRQVGHDLGVNYVLEGTVRWARADGGAGRVRITPQLVRVADDSQLWAQTYDQQIDDIFEVQSNIAGEVIKQLGVTLLGGELAAVEERPTDNLEAYQAFLRATEPPEDVRDDLGPSGDWFVEHMEEATRLDPRFLLAWTRLSEHHSYWYHRNFDRSEARLEQAKQALDRAEEIDENHPNTRLARGYYHYFGFRDYDRALEDFKAAVEALPNDAEARASIGYIHRRQGKLAEAIADLEAALVLAPRDAPTLHGLTQTHRAQRNFDKAIELRQRLAEFSPEDSQNRMALLGLSVQLSGDPEDGLAGWRAWPASDDFWYVFGGVVSYMGVRDFEKAYEWSTKLPGTDPFMSSLRSLMMALCEALRDGVDSARPSLEAVAKQLEGILTVAPANADVRQWLSGVYARLGRGDAAIREARMAIDLTAKDRFAGPKAEAHLAGVYAILGRADDAVDLLERLLGMEYEDAITVTDLRLDQAMDSIRDDPRFQALIAE